MPLDTHQNLCCANSQTAMPHHVSSRTHPPRLRTPAEHLTRSYLPARQKHTWMHFITYINSLPPTQDLNYNGDAVEDKHFLGCHCVNGLVLLVYEEIQCFHLQKLRGTRNILFQVLWQSKNNNSWTPWPLHNKALHSFQCQGMPTEWHSIASHRIHILWPLSFHHTSSITSTLCPLMLQHTT